MKISDQIMREPCGYVRCGEALAEARGKFFVDAVEAAIGEDGDDVAGGELRCNSGNDGVSIGKKLSGRACVVEGADDFLGMQALLLGNSLLLVDSGEDGAIGKAEAFNEIRREDLAAQRVGARLEHGPKASRRIELRGVPGASRGWPWGDGRSPR